MKSKLLFAHVTTTLLMLLATTSHAQDPVPREYVTNTFAGTLVINAHSVEVVPKKRSFGFMIQHRFGAIKPDEQALKQLFGLDLTANIRFAFQYSPVKDTHLEIGRSKNGKTWDLGMKIRLLKQTAEDEVPLSVTVLGNMALMSDEFPATNDRQFFADGITPFAYRFAHRLSYNGQVIIARRFSEHFSMQLSPVAIYRNLVPVGGTNLTVAVVLSARMKVTTKGSILCEVSPIVKGRQPEDPLEPLAIGYEVATQGHVFQIVLCSSQEILEQRVYTMPTSRYNDGYFHLGFNIARTMYVKPKVPMP